MSDLKRRSGSNTEILQATNQLSHTEDSLGLILETLTADVDSGSGNVSVTYSAIKNKTPSHCLFIAHGAKGSMNSPIIKYFHTGLATRGFLTVRFNFPFAEGRVRILRRPDRKDMLVNCYKAVLDDARKSQWHPHSMFLGGISLGAAVASHVISDGPDIAEVKGLFFLSYPIHKPGNTRVRGDTHLSKIRLPTLFVSGTRDFYADPRVVKETISSIGTNAEVRWVEGGDNTFNRGKGKGEHKATLEEVADMLTEWMSSVRPAGRPH